MNGTVVKNVTIDSGSNGGFSLSEAIYRTVKDSASPVGIGIVTTTQNCTA
ncbi:MAG: hypothetical protein QNL61_03790 [Crocinitomicaceae bacterium]